MPRQDRNFEISSLLKVIPKLAGKSPLAAAQEDNMRLIREYYANVLNGDNSGQSGARRMDLSQVVLSDNHALDFYINWLRQLKQPCQDLSLAELVKRFNELVETESGFGMALPGMAGQAAIALALDTRLPQTFKIYALLSVYSAEDCVELADAMVLANHVSPNNPPRFPDVMVHTAAAAQAIRLIDNIELLDLDPEFASHQAAPYLPLIFEAFPKLGFELGRFFRSGGSIDRLTGERARLKKEIQVYKRGV